MLLRWLGAAAGTVVLEPFFKLPSLLAAPSPSYREEKRPLGKTGWTVSTVNMGTMLTSSPDVIRYAVERGVDYIDTAASYMGGENERIVGRALQGIRDKVILATKVGLAPFLRWRNRLKTVCAP